MKPTSELKGFNMERILLKNKNGYFCFGYYKDGMIEVDGEWSHPSTWKEWCSIAELKYALEVS
jgi:hypothetical protein